MKKLLLLSILLPTLMFGQYTEKKEQKDISVSSRELPKLTDYKNTIRWNMTPMVLFGRRNINIGYERVLTENSTVSINVGYLEIPEIFNLSENVVYVEGKKKRGGFSIFADYKRYFTNRNKRSAPEGIYWGAFSGVYNQKFGNHYTLEMEGDDGTQLKGEADLTATINNYNFGLELGYQFVFFDRLTVDLIVIGPAASIYTGKIEGDFSGNLDQSEEFRKFVELIYDKVPWLEDSIDGDQLNAKGSTARFAAFGSNFRYVAQVGFRF